MKTGKFLRTLCIAAVCCLVLCGFNPMVAQAAKKSTGTNRTYAGEVFDADYYYNTYPDVAAAIGMNPAKLLDHYVTYGIREGRNASAVFNATIYKNNYSDLKVAFGANLFSYCHHYAEYGIAEGRNAIDNLNPNAAQGGSVIASYSTEFNTKIGRATNVRLAASQIDGIVLQPNDTFSFLGSITPRTLENGYVVATVFSGGKVSKGIGGGICQVSSTLYAAVLGTTCTVNERHSHSLSVSYVPKGMDATVSAPSLDFRFTNTYSQPLLINASEDSDGVLTVTLTLQ